MSSGRAEMRDQPSENERPRSHLPGVNTQPLAEFASTEPGGHRWCPRGWWRRGKITLASLCKCLWCPRNHFFPPKASCGSWAVKMKEIALLLHHRASPRYRERRSDSFYSLCSAVFAFLRCFCPVSCTVPPLSFSGKSLIRVHQESIVGVAHYTPFLKKLVSCELIVCRDVFSNKQLARK